jgi:hypothetical protein
MLTLQLSDFASTFKVCKGEMESKVERMRVRERDIEREKYKENDTEKR